VRARAIVGTGGPATPIHAKDVTKFVGRVRPTMVQGPAHNAYALEGLVAAAKRLEYSRISPDVGASFVAVAEGLLWVMVLDDRFRRSGGPYAGQAAAHEHGRCLAGLRYVWNLLKHADLDDMVDLTEGAAWPIQWPVTWFELSWKPLASLPGMPKAQTSVAQVQSYVDHLAEKPVRHTLSGAMDFIRAEAVHRRDQAR
jgi:hypothetical protein